MTDRINPFADEQGKAMHEPGYENTGEPVAEGRLAFEVWAYARMGSGWTICARQQPPQEMAEALGQPIDPVFWTINIARGMTTYLPFAEADEESQRIPFDWLPDDAQAAAFAYAGQGWVWDDVEHYFDPSVDGWVAA